MFDKAMHMNPKERKELAISEIVLIVLGVIGLAAVLWFAWFRPSSSKTVNSYEACVAAGNPVQESYPSACVSKDGKRFVNPKEQVRPSAPNVTERQPVPSTPAPAAGRSYLTLTEWGVRVPLTADTADLKYTFHTSTDGDRASFTFTRLENIGICITDVGMSLTRSTVENKIPFNIDNPEPIAHIGQYYYYLAQGGSPCFDSNNAEHMKVVNTINGGNLTGAVKSLLQKLESAS